jgi:hypothetical protein
VRLVVVCGATYLAATLRDRHLAVVSWSCNSCCTCPQQLIDAIFAIRVGGKDGE